MIDKLHNMANTILGIEKIRYYDENFRFTVISSSGDYIIEITNENQQVVKPKKDNRDGTYEYFLSQGVYYLRAFSKDDNGNKLKEVYYEDIYISSEMLDMSRTEII